MNTETVTSGIVNRGYGQPQDLSGWSDVNRCPARTVARVAAGKHADTDISCPALELSASWQTDVVLPAGTVLQVRSEVALQRQAEAQEVLICEAETALASQTVHTYRQWYACWRRRGVRANDLLDMTWVWHERARNG